MNEIGDMELGGSEEPNENQNKYSPKRKNLRKIVLGAVVLGGIATAVLFPLYNVLNNNTQKSELERDQKFESYIATEKVRVRGGYGCWKIAVDLKKTYPEIFSGWYTGDISRRIGLFNRIDCTQLKNGQKIDVPVYK